MRWIFGTSRPEDRLLWSRDERWVQGLANRVPGSRVLHLASGALLLGNSEQMTDALIASRANTTPYGLVHLDASLPDADRYVTALAEAVQQSGIADRIGMLTSPTAGFRKVLDAFLPRREVLEIRYQPIVALNSMEAVGYETLCRPSPAVASIDGVVEAAVATGRTVELDRLIFERVLERTARLDPIPPHVTINHAPGQPGR